MRDAELVAGDAWPSFLHHVDPAARAEARLPDAPDGGYHLTGTYGHHTPGEGVTVGHHGTGPFVDTDARDFTAEPGRLAELRAYVRRGSGGPTSTRCRRSAARAGARPTRGSCSTAARS